jgi:hypothetical protein
MSKMQKNQYDSKPRPFIASVPRNLTVTLPALLDGDTWEYTDINEGAGMQTNTELKERGTLYMVVAGDNQTPCRWNGRQLTVEWIDDNGVPLFSHDQAISFIECTYQFFASVGRSAYPILRAVPVIEFQTAESFAHAQYEM